MITLNNGVFPTMITPYKNGEIDYEAVSELVEFYIKSGCTGIFAVCQSSEMWYMSLKERARLARAVVEKANGRIQIVASGHIGNSLEEQAEEIDCISRTGIDAFVMVSNRLDLHNDGDDVWIENAEKLMEMTNKDIPFGIYECPYPYKRLLTPKLLDWCVESKRFAFIKDTCCNIDTIRERIEQLKGSGCKLYNANGQTLLDSLKAGCNGYSGVMANFYPDLLSWLCSNYNNRPETAQQLADAISITCFAEGMAYPATAKYYLQLCGLNISTWSRSRDDKVMTGYQKDVMAQMYRICDTLRDKVIGWTKHSK